MNSGVLLLPLFVRIWQNLSERLVYCALQFCTLFYHLKNYHSNVTVFFLYTNVRLVIRNLTPGIYDEYIYIHRVDAPAGRAFFYECIPSPGVSNYVLM